MNTWRASWGHGIVFFVSVLPNSRLQRTPAAQARLGADEPQGRYTYSARWKP